jgi:putative exosortase-associated protein (TIGR04073 family)
MKWLLGTTLALMIVLLVAAPCYAENCMHKLGRGLINTATGWCEYPNQIIKTSQDENAAVGATWGQVKGVAYGVGRTAAGIHDTSTFFLPPYDMHLMEPEYVIEF